jgi:uncharacterized protein YbjQ (UPF0145 family)
MILTTTSVIQGKTVCDYRGIVTGEAIVGANAVVGVGLDDEVVGQNGSMLMVTACGTAVSA